jgi:phage gp16-like protein
MAYSQNGYKAKDFTLIASYTAPGTNVRVSVRKGDVSVVLLYLMEQFNKHVEPLRQVDTGGYNPRSILGGNVLSNHASGTAVDLNWNSHPMGRRGTFTATKVKAIRKILAFLDGVVRWGGDYRTRPDDMHFEVVASPAKVATVANKIRASWANPPAKKPIPAYPAYPGKPLKRGTFNNNDVRAFQAKMQARGWRRMKPDGDFGSVTEDLVRQFQREKKLKVDGIVGPKTWKAIFTAPK